MATLTPFEILTRIAAAEKMKDDASDKVASRFVALYPSLNEDASLIKAGTRISFKGELYRARADLWDTAENSPENAPTLWDLILYRKGIRIIPEQIVTENPFTKGELGWWGDALYRSRLDTNVYTPAQYAAGWEEVKS
jgi:hypothetical protein